MLYTFPNREQIEIGVGNQIVGLTRERARPTSVTLTWKDLIKIRTNPEHYVNKLIESLATTDE